MIKFLKERRIAVSITALFFGLLFYFSFAHFRSSTEIFESSADNQNIEVSNKYKAPVRLADLENQAIKESSGIAASRNNADQFWTHNDSGDGPFIYAIDREGKHRGVWRVAGASARDWEDIAVGPGPNEGQSYIYIGDIGDNSESRNEIVVYRVAEPLIDPKDSSSTARNPLSTEPADVIRLKYPDGKHNAETLLVHPATGDLYIITKVNGEAAGVYKLTAPIAKSEMRALMFIAQARFPNLLAGLITGGDISPDGRRVILCDYLGACELVLPDKASIAFDEIWKQPMLGVNLGSRRQGEAICYRADGMALLATSEGLPCPLIEVPRISRE
jgi:hypothetical protein